MNRIKKELTKRGLIYKADEIDILLKGIEYDEDRKFLFCENGFIVILYSSAVLDTTLEIYDRNFNCIGQQNLWYDKQMQFSMPCFAGWNSIGFTNIDED